MLLHASHRMITTTINPPSLSSFSSPPQSLFNGVTCTTIPRTSSSNNTNLHRNLSCSCKVALKDEELSPSSSNGYDEEMEKELANAKVGARVKVKVPLKVCHVPKVPEVDLAGMEGVIKQYVAIWKGKRISANFPYKVEFVAVLEGRGSVKFSAHLRDDEFDYLDKTIESK